MAQGIPSAPCCRHTRWGPGVAWRQMSQRALERGSAPNALAALAEAVFCFVDQLSSASAAGYLAEQSEAACGP